MTQAQLEQLDATLAIANEVERHANAIDPRDPTAAGVQNELIIDLAGGLRHLVKIVREIGIANTPNQIFAGPATSVEVRPELFPRPWHLEP